MLTASCNKRTDSWVVYYDDKLPPSSFLGYQTIVLDSDYHPPLDLLVKNDKDILGYISMGEVEHIRSHYQQVKDQDILMQENEHWPGSYYVDVRSKYWQDLVVEKLVPDILAKGFKGIFIDTLDNMIELERVDPIRYRGMVKASVEMIRAIRQRYPNIMIMLNRAYAIAEEVGADIDIVLGESVYADWKPYDKSYGYVEPDLYKEQVSLLQGLQKQYPNLRIYTLDYWYTDDIKTLKEIYHVQRKNGFSPYVSTLELNSVVPSF